jgi:hypothetical protein
MRHHLAAACALAVTLIAMTGCSGMGSKDFACPGYPGQPLCLPTSEVYRLTNGSGPPPAAMQREETGTEKTLSELRPEDIW